MRPVHLVASALLATTGCYQAAPPQTTYPEPATWQGPPGGEIDPGWAATGPAPEAPGYPGYPAGYPDGSYPPGEGDAPAPSGDPSAPGYVMGDVTDAEIDTTLAPYGQWVETDEYGRVWRPDVTIVGGDFTPYDTCGTWVDTDYGWAFACDWDWGWLPFHYGRWAYLDDAYWGWVPDYTWGPAWVEWRGGGDYVGWRPLGPSVRDHRTGRGRPNIRDHRTGAHGDDHWRFATTAGFGRPHVHDHLIPARDALAATAIVPRSPVRGALHGSAASIMRPRLDARFRAGHAPRAVDGRTTIAPAGRTFAPPSRYPATGPYAPPAGYRSGTTYAPPARYPASGTYAPPARYPGRGTYAPPARYPAGGTYAPPARYPSGGTYAPPARSYGAGSTYSPPAYSPPSYSPPSYSPPSRSSGSSGSSGSSYSPPSRSSGSSGSSGSSYSPPSHSSSSSSGSRDHRR